MEIFVKIVIILIILSLVKALISGGLLFIFDNPKKRGSKFEQKVAKELGKTFGTTVYANLIPNKVTDDELNKICREQSYEDAVERARQEAEVDMAFVTKKGLFCIECKSKKFGSVMKGSLNQSSWDVRQIAGVDRMMNPFDQNYKHVLSFSRAGLMPTNLIYNVVITNADFVFTYCGLKRESRPEPFINMMKNRDEMMALIGGEYKKGIRQFKAAVDELPDLFSEEDVEGIKKELVTYTATKKDMKNHIKHVNGMWKMKRFKV